MSSSMIERMPALGSKPVTLIVKLPPLKHAPGTSLGHGLQELYRLGQFSDVSFVCVDKTFYAHRAVLAATSQVFKAGLAEFRSASQQEVRLPEICNPEAVKIMLDYIYGLNLDRWEDYNPKTQEINKDVLRLAQNFVLPGLTEKATHWLTKDLSTGNILEVLAICEEFNLSELGDRILDQLTQNRRALTEVVSSPKIMQHAKFMQALLQHAASQVDDKAEVQEDSQLQTPKSKRQNPPLAPASQSSKKEVKPPHRLATKDEEQEDAQLRTPKNKRKDPSPAPQSSKKEAKLSQPKKKQQRKS